VALGRISLRFISVRTVSITAPMLHTRLHLTTQLLSKKKAGEAQETSNKVKFLWISDNTGQESTFEMFCKMVSILSIRVI